jgi:membrane complex biogenesis BtpA family protein
MSKAAKRSGANGKTSGNGKLHAGWAGVKTVVIGMLHLPALPGSPRYAGDVKSIRDRVLADAKALRDGGVHGLMLENFGDVPFFTTDVPKHVVAQITAIACTVREAVPDLPLGINVLRNDGCAALGVAAACGAQFVRVNVLCGARVTDQGVIQGIAAELLRLRAQLDAGHVKIFADVDVKHSAPLAARPLEDEVHDTVLRGLADALIVSGAGTGKATDPGKLADVKRFAGGTPVFVGSGVTDATARDLATHADGLIVGTSLKRGGDVDAAVDVGRVRKLIELLR